VKTILVNDLASPMELAVTPDGRVFFSEIQGNLSVYDTKTRKNALVHKFPITYVGGTGLIGLTIDPNFAKNQHIYVYYTPAGQTEEPINFQLSRFTVNANNTLDLKSEKNPVEGSGGEKQRLAPRRFAGLGQRRKPVFVDRR
jgi:cytochrome c